MPSDLAVWLASGCAAAAVFLLTGGRVARPRLDRLFGARSPLADRRSDAQRRRLRRLGKAPTPGAGGWSKRGSDAARWSRPAPSSLVPNGQPSAAPAAGSESARMRWLAALMAGLASAVVVGGALGVLIGLVTALTVHLVVGRLEPRAVRQRRERVMRDVPAAASLLAAAVSAGATPVAAVEVVAIATGGPLGDDLYRLAASARLGGDFPMATAGGASEPVARLSRVIARAIATGAPLAASLDRLATDLHAERSFEIDRRARSVGVRAAAPLGLCFLPGFLLIGVVPVIAGIAATVLGTVL